MGCNKSKEIVNPPPSDPKWKKYVVNPEISLDDWITQVRQLPPPKEGYWRQFIAVVRHGHRRDREDRAEWMASSDGKTYPYDCRLTEKGVATARNVGRQVKKLNDIANFGLVVSSPYIRCVETAVEIADEVGTPILCDKEFGEIFDDVYMPHAKGKVQYREASTITKIVDEKSPKNKFIRDANGDVRMFGTQPEYPEPMIDAQLRFLERFESTAVKAVERQHGLVIVTHGDCVVVLLALMCQYAEVIATDYCAYFFVYRDVELPDKGEPMWKEKLWKKAESTSVFASEWNSKIGPIIEWKPRPPSENPFSDVQAEESFGEAKQQTMKMVDDYRLNKKDRQLWTLTPAAKGSDAVAGLQSGIPASAIGPDGVPVGVGDDYEDRQGKTPTMTRSAINNNAELQRALTELQRSDVDKDSKIISA